MNVVESTTCRPGLAADAFRDGLRARRISGGGHRGDSTGGGIGGTGTQKAVAGGVRTEADDRFVVWTERSVEVGGVVQPVVQRAGSAVEHAVIGESPERV